MTTMMSSRQSESAEGSRAGTIMNSRETMRDSSSASLPQNDKITKQD